MIEKNDVKLSAMAHSQEFTDVPASITFWMSYGARTNADESERIKQTHVTLNQLSVIKWFWKLKQ